METDLEQNSAIPPVVNTPVFIPNVPNDLQHDNVPNNAPGANDQIANDQLANDEREVAPNDQHEGLENPQPVQPAPLNRRYPARERKPPSKLNL